MSREPCIEKYIFAWTRQLLDSFHSSWYSICNCSNHTFSKQFLAAAKKTIFGRCKVETEEPKKAWSLTQITQFLFEESKHIAPITISYEGLKDNMNRRCFLSKDRGFLQSLQRLLHHSKDLWDTLPFPDGWGCCFWDQVSAHSVSFKPMVSCLGNVVSHTENLTYPNYISWISQITYLTRSFISEGRPPRRRPPVKPLREILFSVYRMMSSPGVTQTPRSLIEENPPTSGWRCAPSLM